MATKKKTVQPKMIIKEETEVFHHCFKLTPTLMTKNLSWRKGHVIPDRIEHGHYFHTINSMGMPQKRCNHVGGHFHEVTWSVDDEGNLVAKCGPALRKVHKKLPNGRVKSVVEPIEYIHFDDNGDKRVIKDDHTHEIEYKHSNRLSMGQAQNAAVDRTPSEPKSVDRPDVSLDVLP